MSEVEHPIEESASGKPKPDSSPPQNRLILIYTLLAVGSLVGLKFVLDSFLDTTRRAAQADNIAHSEASERLAEFREETAARLNEGEPPISEAMEQLATRGRGGFPQLRPFPSSDRGAMDGWNRRGPDPRAATPQPE